MKAPILSLLFAFGVLVGLAGQESIRLSASGETPLTDRAGLWFNADPGAGLEAAQARGDGFSPVAGRQVWVGRAAPVSWLRFSLDRPESVKDWLLEVRPSFSIILDQVDLYLPDADGTYRHIVSGTLNPTGKDEWRSRHFVFELPESAFDGRPIYLRAQSAMDVEFHLVAWESRAKALREALELAAYGIILGILAGLALYSFFLFVSLRDRAYLYYVLYLAAAGAWLFEVQGLARFVRGGMPALDQNLLWLFAGSMLAMGAAFASPFLKLRENRPVLFFVDLGFVALGLFAAIAGFAGFHGLAFSITNALGGLLSAFLILAALSRMAQGYAPARFFLVAWIALALAGFTFVLMNYKVLPVSFLTVNSTAIGMAAESVLLSMALADRFKRLERERLTLERSRERYRELSLTDALTGLYNRRFLAEELESAVAAAGQDGTLSVILLDIDGFKGINDTYGHGFGDEVLKALSVAIRESIRDSDSPCRSGGEEFVIVMPGTASADALRVAERIRERFAAARIEAPACGEGMADGLASGELTRPASGPSVVGATVSLGVAELERRESSASLLERADRAMYEAKSLGKNRSVLAARG